MKKIQSIDLQLMQYFQCRMKTPRMDRIMPVITRLGNGGIVWICIALILISNHKYRYAGERVLAALVVGAIFANILIKPIVGRLRPCADTSTAMLIKRPSDYSFPSGHALSSFSAATLLFWASPLLGVFAIILASFIAFSRVYLYVHYPSDVAVGIVLGVAISLFILRY